MSAQMPLNPQGLPREFLVFCRRYGLVTQHQALDAVESWLAHPERRPPAFSSAEADALRIRLLDGLPADERKAAPDFTPPPSGVPLDRPPPSGAAGKLHPAAGPKGHWGGLFPKDPEDGDKPHDNDPDHGGH